MAGRLLPDAQELTPCRYINYLNPLDIYRYVRPAMIFFLKYAADDTPHEIRWKANDSALTLIYWHCSMESVSCS